jgi:hypothetical protein
MSVVADTEPAALILAITFCTYPQVTPITLPCPSRPLAPSAPENLRPKLARQSPIPAAGGEIPPAEPGGLHPQNQARMRHPCRSCDVRALRRDDRRRRLRSDLGRSIYRWRRVELAEIRCLLSRRSRHSHGLPLRQRKQSAKPPCDGC